MGVNGVSGIGVTSATSQVATVKPNGTIEIDFNGKKVTVTKADAERFLETYNKLNYPAQRIAELEQKQAELKNGAKLNDDDAAELVKLKNLLANQRAAASFEISPDGKNVNFKLKKDINVEEFKKLFNIEHGAFREEIKKEALEDGRYAGDARMYSNDGEPYYGFNDAAMAGVTEFSNGLKLIFDQDGKYYPDYTGVQLHGGFTYEVPQSKIDEHSGNKPWYQFW